MSSAAASIRVMVVDDHEVVRAGVRAVLGATDDIVVCAEASSCAEAIDMAAAANPDVVVMDVRLGRGSGIDATREIRARRPGSQVIMLTSYSDDATIFASIGAGAAGFVLKTVRSNGLVSAVRSVAGGEGQLDPSVTGAVLARLRQDKELLSDPKLARLSAQEQRVLGLVAEGLTNGQIGERLHVAEKTVKNYLSHILSKLGMARRAEAAAHYSRHATETRMLTGGWQPVAAVGR